MSQSTKSAAALGFFILAGLVALGYLLGNAVITFKSLERTVTVKGLSEREVAADIAIWPISFLTPQTFLPTISGDRRWR